jgi:hypothetical protein
MWIIILSLIAVAVFFKIKSFGTWQSTMSVIVGNYYLDKLENDKLSEKELFMNFLDKRYPERVTSSKEQNKRKEIAKQSLSGSENLNIVTLIYTCFSIEKYEIVEREDAIDLIKGELKKELPKFLKRVGITGNEFNIK